MSTAKKPAAKKPAAKKPAAKKPAAKKPAAKKPAAKKPVAKKPAAKKTATKKPAAKKKPTAKKPAAKKKPAAEKPAPSHALVLEARLWQPGEGAEEIGEVEIPSGVVMVADAGTLAGPVKVAIAAGKYRVRVVRNEDGDNESAALVAPGAAPVSWDEIGAYPVDAGMSGFFDGSLFEKLDRVRWPISLYDDLVSKHLDPAERKGHAGAFVPFEGARFSACASGYGDGVYPVFAGRDAKGATVAVVTQFIWGD